MSDISSYLNQIKSAIYGEEVRGAIHDAIELCYDDATSAVLYNVVQNLTSAQKAQARANISACSYVEDTDGLIIAP